MAGHAAAQPHGTLVRYHVAAQTTNGGVMWAEPDPLTGMPTTFAYHVDREQVPQWVKDAVIYHVFVDRFNPGDGRAWNAGTNWNDFWGGTIKGVTEKLPYLEALGATCVWLSPIFPSPTHHGYNATDYFGIEPRLGTQHDLREFCEAAHARGIRVILDFVANHLSNEHPLFQRAISDANAPEHAWFTWERWPNEYRSFFGVRSMPQINVEHPPARRHLIDAATFWLEQGADGFRLDYANGPSHAFWTEFRAATRAAKPDSFTVGEVVETADLQRSFQGRMDGTLDFLLLQNIRAFFAFDTIGAGALDSFLQRHLHFFRTDFVLPSFLDNHDMNRFLWVVQGDVRRLKLAALLQFTLPFPPIIYYGTEVGLSQHHDLQYPDGSRRMEESRTLMPWDDVQDADLLQFYTQLIALRRDHADLWRGTRRTLALHDDGVYVVLIGHGDQHAIVALNRTEHVHTIDLPQAVPLALGTDSTCRLEGARLVLPPMSAALLMEKNK